jgi:hypothetical protein
MQTSEFFNVDGDINLGEIPILLWMQRESLSWVRAKPASFELGEICQGLRPIKEVKFAVFQLLEKKMIERVSDETEVGDKYLLARAGLDYLASVVLKEGRRLGGPIEQWVETRTRLGTEAINLASFDSTKWTGKQLKLVDTKVIADVRSAAEQVKVAFYAMRFESNSDSQNLKSLADALVAICSMAEPEVTIIDRILASPKFQAYAGLVTLVATIRGASGI